MNNQFYAMLSRMKYINRWSLMRNTRNENLCEHSYDVAMISHALAVVTNTRFNGNVDEAECVLRALYHDTSEIITGDLPTPVKYDNPTLRDAYKQLEAVASQKLLSMLPDDLQEAYEPYFAADEKNDEEGRIVKAADKISALIKCIEELQQGNHDFSKARTSTEQSIRDMCLPAADVFLDEFIPAYLLTLDEQNAHGNNET